MTFTVDIPRFDYSNYALSPLVLSAKTAGAVVRNHATNPALITIEFATEAAANAFAASIAQASAPTQSTVRLASDQSIISTNASAGQLVSKLTQTYGSTTVYATVGTVPAQLALNGRNIVRGPSPAVAGTNYSIRIRASNADNTRAVEETFPFTGVTGGAVIDPEPEPEPIPAPSFSLSNAVTHAEGNSGTTAFVWTLTLNRDGSTDAINYSWSVAGSGASPADANDFGGSFPLGAGTFAPGETVKTITVLATGDTAVEPDETFTLTVTGLNTVTSLGTISNDDVAPEPEPEPEPAPSLSLSAAVAQNEGDSGSTAFTWVLSLNRDGSTAAFNYSWAVVGSGTNPADAADFGGSFPSGTGTFATGETSKNIVVIASGDTAVELDETFTLTVSAPGLNTVSSIGTIINDDVAPDPEPEPEEPSAPMSSIDASGWKANYSSTPSISDPVSYTVSRQGFDASGSSSTINETQYVTTRVREPWPNQSTLTPSTVALSDYVYSTDTIGGVTNNSTEASPKPIANFVTLDQKVVGNQIGGSVLPVEVCAFHRNGIAAVRYVISDGTNTVTSTVSTITVSPTATDKNAVLVYSMPLTDITSLADGGIITVNAEVYPKIGTSVSVLRSVDQTAAREFSPRYFGKNVARFTAPVFVYVSATGTDATVTASGATSGGIQKVSTDPAIAMANAFATPASAATALRVASSLTGGFTSGCIMRVLGTVSFSGGWTSATYQNTNAGALYVEGHDNDAVALSPSGNVRQTVIWRNIRLVRNSTSFLTSIRWENVILDNGSNSSGVGQGSMTINGLTVLNGAGTMFPASATNEVRLFRGVAVSSVVSTEYWNVVGCHLTNGGGFVPVLSTRTLDGGIVAFNRLEKITGNPIAIDTTNTFSGLAFVQNVFEFVGTNQANFFRFSGDSGQNNTTHLCAWNNTIAAFWIIGRQNWFYVDGSSAASHARVHKLHSVRNNIFSQMNMKGEIFIATNEGDTVNAPNSLGNWSQRYGVGWCGNMSQFIDASLSGVGQGSSFAQDYAGRKANYGTSQSVRNDPLFTDNRSTVDTSTAGAGNGTYSVQAGSPAIGVVTAAEEVLPFDMAGQPRDRGTIGSYR